MASASSSFSRPDPSSGAPALPSMISIMSAYARLYRAFAISRLSPTSRQIRSASSYSRVAVD
jgi:hypothetical protein